MLFSFNDPIKISNLLEVTGLAKLETLDVTGAISINGTEVISSSGTLATSALPPTSQFEDLNVTGTLSIADNLNVTTSSADGFTLRVNGNDRIQINQGITTGSGSVEDLGKIEYLYLFIKYYPILSYLMMMYRCYEYIGYINRIYSMIMYIITPKVVNKELDEIYEIIIETEPGKYETILEDETGYVKHNEDKKIIKEYL